MVRKGALLPASKSRMAAAARTPKPARLKASLELALLGLIAERHPVSGYDLVQTFRVSMVHYWHAHPGQIYPTLERMERSGWIRGREIIQRGRPNKRVYALTSEGWRVLLEWLQSPYEPLKLKNPPLLRCRFLGHLGADAAREKILEGRRAMEQYLELLRGFDREFAEAGGAYNDVNTMFVYFTLRKGIAFAQAEIEFADWSISEIEANRALFNQSNGPTSQRVALGNRKTARRSRAAS